MARQIWQVWQICLIQYFLVSWMLGSCFCETPVSGIKNEELLLQVHKLKSGALRSKQQWPKGFWKVNCTRLGWGRKSAPDPARQACSKPCMLYVTATQHVSQCLSCRKSINSRGQVLANSVVSTRSQPQFDNYTFIHGRWFWHMFAKLLFERLPFCS